MNMSLMNANKNHTQITQPRQKKRAKMPIFPFSPPNCALISDFFAGNFFDFCCFQNLLKTLNL